MNLFPFETYDISEDKAQLILEIYNQARKEFKMEADFDFTLDIKEFDVLRDGELNDYGPVFKFESSTRPFYLNFLEIFYRTGGKYSPEISIESQTWGYINLKKNFGRILIKPETLLDKIYDLINSIDLDFEDDKEFSKNFLLVTNDKLKAQLQISQPFRDYVKQINLKEFVIEINDDKLIIGDKKVISLESSIEFAKFLEKIAQVF